MPEIAIFAVGNPSRGDDALGPLLAVGLVEQLESAGLISRFEVIEDFQLQVEHILDLEGRSLALFLDAGTGTRPPYIFQRIVPAVGYGHTTHALSPEELLQVYRQTLGREPPPAFLLCVRGEAFDLGKELTRTAACCLDEALKLTRRLICDPTVGAWAALQQNISGKPAPEFSSG